MLEHLRDKHGLRTNEAEEDRKRSEHGLPLGKKRNRMAPETAEARMCSRYWLEFAELTDDDWTEAKQKERALLARLEEQDARWLAQSESAAGDGIGEDGDEIGDEYGDGDEHRDSDRSGEGSGEGDGFSGRGGSGRGSRGVGSGGGMGGPGLYQGLWRREFFAVVTFWRRMSSSSLLRSGRVMARHSQVANRFELDRGQHYERPAEAATAIVVDRGSPLMTGKPAYTGANKSVAMSSLIASAFLPARYLI
jgi:hypothetical protein